MRKGKRKSGGQSDRLPARPTASQVKLTQRTKKRHTHTPNHSPLQVLYIVHYAYAMCAKRESERESHMKFAYANVADMKLLLISSPEPNEAS